jgi:hypothetical protein
MSGYQLGRLYLMVSRNAEKQRRHRQRLRARGLVLVQAWVTPEQAEIIHRILRERGEESTPAARGGRLRSHPPSGE